MFRHIYIRLFVLLAVAAALLSGSILLFTYSYPLSACLVLAVAIGVFYTATAYSKRGYRELADFLDALSFGDTTYAGATVKKPNSLKKLFAKMREVRTEYIEKSKSDRSKSALFADLIERIPVGIMAYDEKGEISIFNSEASRLLQIGKPKETARLAKLRPLFTKELNALLVGGSSLFSYSSSGKETKILIRKNLSKLSGNSITTVIFHDIEAEYHRLEMRSWEKLLSILTHEIANSVTAITSLSQSAISMTEKLEDLPESLKPALEAINRRSQKLVKFVSDYRSLSEIPKPKTEVFSLKNLLEELREHWHMRDEGIRIQVNCPANAIIRADESQLILCFENFFLNSKYAMRDSAEQEIQIDVDLSDGERIEVRFSDKGTGMEGDPDRALVPFYTTRPEGKGIGLAMARQIIRNHGGTLSVKNSDTGFEVRFTLPLVGD